MADPAVEAVAAIVARIGEAPSAHKAAEEFIYSVGRLIRARAGDPGELIAFANLLDQDAERLGGLASGGEDAAGYRRDAAGETGFELDVQLVGAGEAWIKMGTRGPPAKPTHLKLLRGNPGCRALNQHEPRPGLLANPPPPPDTLTGYARDEWDRIIGELYHLKLVTAVDIHPLAAYCEAFKRWKTAVRTLDEMAERDPVMRGQIVKTQSGGAAPNPIVMIADKAARDMVRFAGEFGLTPAARSRISTEPDDPTDKFRGFIAR